MKPVRVYEYKGCSTCRKAIAYLEAKGVPYERIPIRDQPPSLEELKQMLEILQGNLKKLFNTSGGCLLYTSPSPRDQRGSRMPSSA